MSERVKTGSLSLLLLLLIALVYRPGLSNRAACFSEDYDRILANPALGRADSLTALVSKDYCQTFREGGYRPLASLAHSAVYRLCGPYVPAFNGLKALALWGSASCVLLLGLRLLGSPPAAFLAASLYALHPANACAIGCASFLPDVSVALFVILSFYAHLRLRETGRRRWLVLAAGSFAAALLSKETAIVLPLLILSHDAVFPTARTRLFLRRACWEWAGLAGVLAAYLLLLKLRIQGESPYGPMQFDHAVSLSALARAAWEKSGPLFGLGAGGPGWLVPLLLLFLLAGAVLGSRRTAAFFALWVVSCSLPIMVAVLCLPRFSGYLASLPLSYLSLAAAGACWLLALASRSLVCGLPPGWRTAAWGVVMCGLLYPASGGARGAVQTERKTFEQAAREAQGGDDRLELRESVLASALASLPLLGPQTPRYREELRGPLCRRYSCAQADQVLRFFLDRRLYEDPWRMRAAAGLLRQKRWEDLPARILSYEEARGHLDKGLGFLAGHHREQALREFSAAYQKEPLSLADLPSLRGLCGRLGPGAGRLPALEMARRPDMELICAGLSGENPVLRLDPQALAAGGRVAGSLRAALFNDEAVRAALGRDYAAALRMLGEALAADPENLNARLTRAAVFSAAGDLGRSLREYETVLEKVRDPEERLWDPWWARFSQKRLLHSAAAAEAQRGKAAVLERMGRSQGSSLSKRP